MSPLSTEVKSHLLVVLTPVFVIAICKLLVYVIACVAVKFGINTTSVVLEMWKISRGKPSEITHFQYNKSGIYPKFSLLYPCYSMLIPYSLTFVGVSMYAMYKLHY